MKLHTAAALSLAWMLSASHAAERLNLVTEPFPPFTYEEKGQPAGPFVDVVMAVCQRIKTECKIEVMPWRRALAMAEEGEVDGIFTVVRVPEREKFFFLTEPVVDSAYTLFAIDSSTFVYRQPKDLEGFTVSVNDQSGTAKVLEETVKGLRNVSIAGEAQHLIALRKLSHGRYPGNALAFVNREVALQLAKDDGITNLKPVGDVRKIQYHIGFSRKKVNDATFTQFNDALRAQIKEGKVKGILDKYGMKRSD